MKSNQGVGYYQNSRGEVAPFLPPSYSKVLEVGCGDGAFSVNLDSRCEHWGVEPVAEAAARASLRLHKVLGGTFQEVAGRLPDGYFDLVVCNDVIEHMPDHDEFLRTIKTKMTAAGYLVGSIPNVRHARHLYHLLVEKDWRYAGAGTLDRTHLRFFTEKSWRRALGEHGFIVEKCQGITPATQWGNRLVIRLIELMTLGYYGDIGFFQFGFRARCPEAKEA
jgi:2-polyprenyl-3-methyl-5-hydroxy-6-metoxy-1,4-benzoquinol methylase